MPGGSSHRQAESCGKGACLGQKRRAKKRCSNLLEIMNRFQAHQGREEAVAEALERGNLLDATVACAQACDALEQDDGYEQFHALRGLDASGGLFPAHQAPSGPNGGANTFKAGESLRRCIRGVHVYTVIDERREIVHRLRNSDLSSSSSSPPAATATRPETKSALLPPAPEAASQLGSDGAVDFMHLEYDFESQYFGLGPVPAKGALLGHPERVQCS